MEEIARRLGGSKRTLYGYFQSKEELFEVAMRAAVEPPGDQITGLLDPDVGDLRAVLERFANAYMGFVLGDDVLALTRTAITEGTSSSLGPHLFEQGPQRAVTNLANFFANQIMRGRLRAESPRLMALHFKGLIEVGSLDAALYGAQPELHQSEAVCKAVEAFLRAYGT